MVSPSTRPAYPLDTEHKCSNCGAVVIEDEWVHTTANHEGEPEEHTGTGLYCSNRQCTRSTEPFEPWEFDELPQTSHV